MQAKNIMKYTTYVLEWLNQKKKKKEYATC